MPSICHRCVTKMLDELTEDDCNHVLLYVDVILITSFTREECIERTVRVLHIIESTGFKINPQMVQFAQTTVKYLGLEL